MKRIGILLIVLLVLAWISSKINDISQPKVTTQPQPPAAAITAPLTPTEKKAEQEKWFGTKTIVAAKRAVTNSLKDPNSAEFKNVYANYTDGYGVVACGYVNAKNSFGGYTGYKAFVSSGQSVIMEGQDDIKSAWAAACK